MIAALQYAIDQNLGSVISFSYAGQESDLDGMSGFFATWQFLAQQANAQGITILAASGDTGPRGGDFFGQQLLGFWWNGRPIFPRLQPLVGRP